MLYNKDVYGFRDPELKRLQGRFFTINDHLSRITQIDSLSPRLNSKICNVGVLAQTLVLFAKFSLTMVFLADSLLNYSAVYGIILSSHSISAVLIIFFNSLKFIILFRANDN